MKKTAVFVLCIICCLSMSSCGSILDLIGVSRDGETAYDGTTAVTENDNDSMAADDCEIPFCEGYYSYGDYVMELRFTGDKSNYSYNVVFFSDKTGAQKFYGTVSTSADATAFVTYSYNDDSLRVICCVFGDEYEDSGFKVSFYNGDKLVESLSGDYCYAGPAWTFTETEPAVAFADGTYVNDTYILTVESADQYTSFTIKNSAGVTVFSNRAELSASDNSVVFSLPEEYTGSIIFAAGQSRGKQFVEAAQYGSGSDVPFEGIYSVSE